MIPHRNMIRLPLCCSWAMIVLAACFTSMDGVFGLGTMTSRVLVCILWATCFVSAILAIVYDRQARIVAAIILLLLLLLFLPTL